MSVNNCLVMKLRSKVLWPRKDGVMPSRSKTVAVIGEVLEELLFFVVVP